MQLRIPRIIIAGATSGVGKTSITCSIIHALQKRGYSVQPFKVGPDYIDPIYLSSISRPAYNLDAWLMRQDKLLSSFVSNSNSDVSVIEGVMGYYDGFGSNTNYASTHHVASLTKSNVLLVLDASKTSRSIAATALGFLKFHRNHHIAGIILNKLGSTRHELLCRDALERVNKIPVVGAIPKNPSLELSSRHLGLLSTVQSKVLRNKVLKISGIISKHIDTGKIIKIINSSTPLAKTPKFTYKKKKIKIAVALDTSFNFYYQDNLESLRRQGADLQFFSPTKDKHMPECNGLYIGGGFPEVLSHHLAKNHSMKKSIKKLSEDGLPIYAECGGLMYLTKSISSDHTKHKMVGLFDAHTQMTKKMRLAYTRGKIIAKTPISDTSHRFWGHEFHYSRLQSVSPDSKFAYTLDIGDGIYRCQDGLMQDNTLASYGHLYFDTSNYAEVFVDRCLSYSRR